MGSEMCIRDRHRAMDAVRTMIDRNRDKEDKYLGIPIETCLEVLDE